MLASPCLRPVCSTIHLKSHTGFAGCTTVEHVKQAALAGSDCATLPPKIFAELYKHELTDSGVAAFLKDWASTGQSIL